jgi:hypothetical protein
MSDVGDPKLYAHQPLSVDEVATAVNRLGRETLHTAAPAIPPPPQHAVSELPMMTAAQRFWLAFTGKPGSSGRAGPAYEPGLPRNPPARSADDVPLGIPSQRESTEDRQNAH